MIVLADNRAAKSPWSSIPPVSNRAVPIWRSFHPFPPDEEPAVEENGDDFVYTPHQPSLKAGISEEWDRKNSRRNYLIERESRGLLTPEQKAELEELQETVFAYFETIFPRSRILDDDRLEKLEEKYKIPKEL